MKISSQFTPRQIGNAFNLALLFLCLVQGVRAATPTPSDFGYERIRINGQPARGNRPLLVILGYFPGGLPLGDRNNYEDLVFSLSPNRSVFSYFLDTSNTRFFWSRGGPGVVNLNLAASDARSKFPNNGDGAYAANIISKAMGVVNFQQFDADSNGTVTGDELGILVFHNDVGFNFAATRGANNAQPPDSSVKFDGSASFVYFTLATNNFAVIVHELTHLAGSMYRDDTRDLYGWDCLNQNLTIMSCTGSDANTVHHDSWYKMQFGWVEPRIYSLREGGVASIPACSQASQIDRVDAPIILYDPLHGLKEFFMLEYRTRTSLRGSGYDTNVSGDGLVIWHIVHDKDTNAAIIPTRAAGPSGQTGWQFCTKCSGMFYSGFDLDTPTTSLSRCPAGGTHSPAGRYYCIEKNNPTPTGQVDWRWCSKCQGLFYGPNQSSSHCPASGTHDGSASANYNLRFNATIPGGQPGWAQCRKCQGSFFAAGTTPPTPLFCPAGGNHDGTGSLNYTMHLWEYGVFTRSAPDLSRGSNTVWGSGVTTPNLSWIDGTEMPVKIYVHPFSPGDSSITVEWLRNETLWVDFAYLGAFEFGLFDFPYNTLAEGVTAVPHGGTLNIKAGSSSETTSIAKRMRLQAHGGLVTIGR